MKVKKINVMIKNKYWIYKQIIFSVKEIVAFFELWK